MSKKTKPDQTADDLVGLAQNLFGIDLAKPAGDDDLLDEDLFKVELPKSSELAPVISQADVEFAPATEASSSTTSPAPVPAVVSKPPRQESATPVASVSNAIGADEPFGFGVIEESAASTTSPPVAAPTTMTSTVDQSGDEGLTLPEDFDSEGLTLASDFDDGLTLPPDFDDGLTLAPETATGADASLDEDNAEEAAAQSAEGESSEHREPRRRRHLRRTREDAYWDMLENWQWEEITDDDSPASDRDHSRGRRGDRDRRGDRTRRGREDRSRALERTPQSERTPLNDTPRTAREESRSSEPARRSDRGVSAQSAQPQRGDRPREDRRGRDDKVRSERRPLREEPRREPMPPQVSVRPPATPTTVPDDFGAGIFEDEPQPLLSNDAEVSVSSASSSVEQFVAPSSQAADSVVHGTDVSTEFVDEDVVWDDDSDVRPADVSSVVETSILPASEAAGESDETMAPSDVEVLEEQDVSLRPRRRRRRRRSPRVPSAAMPDGNEGTTFDLTAALATSDETLDFIPSAVADDSAISEVPAEERRDSEEAVEENASERRAGRRPRRRRRGSEAHAGTASDWERSKTAATDRSSDDAVEEPEVVIQPIKYTNIPSWEETIKYLLQPHLVGQNLGPEDEDEGLQNDPRGSGGAEPTPPPPPPRRRRGGGRGRRP